MPGPMSSAQPTTPWASLANLMAPQAQAVSSSADQQGSTPEQQMASQMPNIPELTPEEAHHAIKTGQLSPNSPARLKMPNSSVTNTTTTTQIPPPAGSPMMLAFQKAQQGVDQSNDQSKDAYLQQKQGISQLQDNIDQLQANPRTGIDFRGAIGLAKFLKPDLDTSSMEKSAEASAPPTEQDNAEKMINLKNMLLQRQEGLSKVSDAQLGANIRAAMNNNPQNSELKQSSIDKNNAIAGAQGGRQALQQNAIDERIHMKMMSSLDNNQLLRARYNAIQTLDNTGKIISDAPALTPQLFNEYQQSVYQAISKGNTGVGERAEKYMSDAGISADKIRQYLSGKPVDIGKDSDIVNAVKGFAASERNNLGQNVKDLVGSVGAGQEQMYGRRPDLKGGFDRKVAATLKSFGTPDGAVSAPSGPAGAPQVDADLTKMTPAQLADYVKTHGS